MKIFILDIVRIAQINVELTFNKGAKMKTSDRVKLHRKKVAQRKARLLGTDKYSRMWANFLEDRTNYKNNSRNIAPSLDLIGYIITPRSKHNAA